MKRFFKTRDDILFDITLVKAVFEGDEDGAWDVYLNGLKSDGNIVVINDDDYERLQKVLMAIEV